jgi:hypothetical protein
MWLDDVDNDYKEEDYGQEGDDTSMQDEEVEMIVDEEHWAVIAERTVRLRLDLLGMRFEQQCSEALSFLAACMTSEVGDRLARGEDGSSPKLTRLFASALERTSRFFVGFADMLANGMDNDDRAHFLRMRSTREVRKSAVPADTNVVAFLHIARKLDATLPGDVRDACCYLRLAIPGVHLFMKECEQ